MVSKRETIPFAIPLSVLHSVNKKSNQDEEIITHLESNVNNAEDYFNWFVVWPYIKDDLFSIIITITSTIVLSILNIRIPLELGKIVDELIKYFKINGNLGFNDFIYLLKTPILTLVGLYVLQGVCTFLNLTILAFVRERMVLRLRMKLFKSLLCQDIAFFDYQKTGELMSRLFSDIKDFKSALKVYIFQGIRSLTQTFGCTISLFYLSLKLTIALNIVIPIMIGIGSIIGKFLRKISIKCQEQQANASAVANESLFGVRTVKALAIEDEKLEHFYEKISKCKLWNIKLGIGIGIFQSLSNFSLNILVLGILLFGGYLMSNSELSPGNLTSFLFASQTIQRSLIQFSLLISQYNRLVISGKRIFDYINLNPKIPNKGGKKLDIVNGEINFKNVSFVYPTRKNQAVFKDFNLILKSGEITAICGHSGSGKSTVASLIERFYDVDSGEICIDGIDIRNLDLNWLKGKVIGYINQEPTLFAATIRENIRYGNMEASDEDIVRAAMLANAHDFIQSFERGYDTMIGEKGSTLSGGQKQRIAIARAIVKNPKILILDEATSALDTESEKLIHESLNAIMKGRTVLIIAHRLSTIVNANTIVVLCNGKILEKGTHKELIDNKFVYWNMIKNQEYNGKL